MKYSKTLGSVALSALLLIGMTGCGSDDDVVVGDTISPYQRVAVMDGTWADVPALANTIATYVVNTDEKAVLGYPTNWVIAGANPAGGETYETSDLLPIPAMGAAVTGKSRVIELCNGAYATMATNTGRFHGSALPCEVSVHSDGEKIYVDMLDPDAIFSVFFADLSDEDKANLGAVATAVKGEIRGMVLASLANDAHTESTQTLGPVWDNNDLERIATVSPFGVFSYKLKNGGTFKKGVDDKAIAHEIITALGTDASTADKQVAGLSANSAWRSGRPDPIAIPGVQVVEACSPKYASMATKLGNEYITALPCEITVFVDENDPSILSISFLDPNFMFNVMFEGAVDNAVSDGVLTEDEADAYDTLASTVYADLQKVVNHSLATSKYALEFSH